VGLDELAQWLPRIDIEPVFTAHPTEAVRRALLEKEQLMVASLVDNLDGQRTPGEAAADAALPHGADRFVADHRFLAGAACRR
jgi:phosphoenolpyruvate carboxylase